MSLLTHIRYSIYGALGDLVLFVQFKKREKHPWRNVNFSKVAGFKCHILEVRIRTKSFSPFLGPFASLGPFNNYFKKTPIFRVTWILNVPFPFWTKPISGRTSWPGPYFLCPAISLWSFLIQDETILIGTSSPLFPTIKSY